MPHIDKAIRDFMKNEMCIDIGDVEERIQSMQSTSAVDSVR